ncbi:RNA 2',3'-cyclic phosphodiesterase [Thermanaerovibrio acidaminovorans]|uniref:RNA 2',3'-cyclic phosphodiesterase n=1 Tax=Thermanaerovibrio acidaminovorans TaxID=81462 RepID=UPI00248FB3E2|nr:RNA 2',3'-cyclic phosphodiesterase [Thermanaerovibrio acidaminovorans]
MRCFACLVPPMGVRCLVSSRLEPFRRAFRSVKWVREELMHVTLLFLGEVPRSEAESFGHRLRDVADSYPPINLSLGGMGAFPSVRSPRAIWVGLGGELDVLSSFAERVARCAPGGGGERFVPHMTVGRVRDGEALGEALDEAGLWEVSFEGDKVCAFSVCEVVLMESHLGPGGPRYVPFRRYPLGGLRFGGC